MKPSKRKSGTMASVLSSWRKLSQNALQWAQWTNQDWFWYKRCVSRSLHVSLSLSRSHCAQEWWCWQIRLFLRNLFREDFCNTSEPYNFTIPPAVDVFFLKSEPNKPNQCSWPDAHVDVDSEQILSAAANSFQMKTSPTPPCSQRWASDIIPRFDLFSPLSLSV